MSKRKSRKEVRETLEKRVRTELAQKFVVWELRLIDWEEQLNLKEMQLQRAKHELELSEQVFEMRLKYAQELLKESSEASEYFNHPARNPIYVEISKKKL